MYIISINTIRYIKDERMVSLEKLAIANPWWSKGTGFALQDEKLRELLNPEGFRIKRTDPSLEPNKVYVIKGPRQTGKTSWLKLLVLNLLEKGTAHERDILYFSFDEVKSSTELSNMLNAFLDNPHSGRAYLLLDELQNVREFNSVLKNLYDNGRLANTATIITGSLAHMLYEPGRGSEGNVYYMRTTTFKTFAQSIMSDINADTGIGVNRINQLLGYNFSNEEAEKLLKLLGAETGLESGLEEVYNKAVALSPYILPLSKLFYIYLRTGGYPDSLNSYLKGLRSGHGPEYINPDIYTRTINYLKSDAATLAGKGIGDQALAAKVLDSVFKYVGVKVSYAKMSNEIGTNKVTFTNYIRRLENSFAFIILNGVGEDLEKKETKKLYFSDVLMHYSVGASVSGKPGAVFSEDTINSTQIGKLVEEAVICNIIQIKEEDQMRDYNTYIPFYHSNTGREIDFIYKRNDGSSIGIEVKYQNSTSPIGDIRRIRAVSDYMILSKDELNLRSGVLTLPVCIFLALIKKSAHNM